MFWTLCDLEKFSRIYVVENCRSWSAMFPHQNMRLEWPRISRSRIFGHGWSDLRWVLKIFYTRNLVQVSWKIGFKDLWDFWWIMYQEKAAMRTSLVTFWHNVVKNLFMKYLKCHVNERTECQSFNWLTSVFLIWHKFYWDANPGKTIFFQYLYKRLFSKFGGIRPIHNPISRCSTLCTEPHFQ